MTTLKDLKYVALKGEGYFCKVKQYTDEETGKSYALKQLKKKHYSREDYRYRFLREIGLLNKLSGCKNVIRLIDHGNDIDNKSLWYLMPFAKYNLYDYIKAENATLTQRQKYEIVEQIIHALKFAHEQSILHRDISPNNVLVFRKDGNLNIKVTDFGLGKSTESLSYYTGSSASGYGQILYVSPEQKVHLKDATVRSDIYSLGRLVYFVFTGKDPDNIKPFELSSLVAKAIEDNPEDRFQNIGEFEKHFIALKELHLDETIPIDYVTMQEVVDSHGHIDIVKLHELLVRGNYVDHVYHDYIDPVNTYLLTDDNLSNYYQAVGSGIRDFVKTYSERLDECYQTVRWPFSAMNTFGRVLRKIIETVTDDDTRLLCFKQLWYLAFVVDQWAVQTDLKAVLNDKYVTEEIQTQLAEFIIESKIEVDMSQFRGMKIPKIVNIGITKGNERARQKKQKYEDAD
ncbi:MAG: serine/threonine protein kinase [Nitrospirae bacterium]|nr:MAG: serine/threonine protein kinase [Nitrospirota bacterium]